MNLPAPLSPRSELTLRHTETGLMADQKLELLEYWRSIKQRRWSILSLALVAAAAAAAVVLVMTPEYRATSTVLIEASKPKLLSIEDVYDAGAGTQAREHYQTQVEILKSRDIALRTVKTLKLATHPDFDPRRTEATRWNYLKRQIKTRLGLPVTQTAWTMDTLNDAATARLMDAVDIEPVKLSQLVKINVETTDKALAAQIANTLVESYIEADREARFNISQQASGWLQERLSSLRDKLAKSEASLQTFREKKNLLNIGGSAQTVAGQQVGGATEKLVEARSKRAELESVYTQIQKVRNGNYSKIPAVMRDPSIERLQSEVNVAEKKVVELSSRLGAEHMLLKEARIQLDALRATLTAQRQAVAEGIRRDYQAARATEQQLQAFLGAARTDVQNVNRQEFELAVLEREVESNRQLYEMFMSRAKETNMTADVHSSVARLVDPAIEPNSPAKPKKLLVIALASIAGTFAGVLISMFLGKLDVTLKGGEDAEARLRVPLLSVLPLVRSVKKMAMARLFLDQQHSHYAESIRTARTGVLLSGNDDSHKLVLVTSALPNEGKTTVAINLALAHAQARRTLLIDADVRHPQVAPLLKLPAHSKGLSNLISGDAPRRDCMHVLPQCDNLWVMPIGDLPTNPTELLLSPNFKDALKSMKGEFDVIIIDSAPVELVSDALAITPLMSSVVFVVKAMSTPVPLVKRSIARLQRAGADQLGVVLNQLDFTKAHSTYGAYAQAYGYHQSHRTPIARLEVAA